MIKQKLEAYYEKHEIKIDILFFVGGFIFDIFMLSAPDDLLSILQQIVYLIFIASLIHYEILFRLLKWRPKGWILKIWPYRTLALHFVLGSLLSLYSLFYIKSASIFSSLIFLVVMLALLLANELSAVKKSNLGIKIALHAICVFSFLSVIYPIIFGFVGYFPFGCAAATTVAFYFGQYKLLGKKINDEKVLFRAVLAPVGCILLVFGIFYYLKWIPPVPLSTVDQGVYHLVEKRDGKYLLSYDKFEVNFFNQKKNIFLAQPTDKIYFFAQIYSPTRIADEVVVHWFQKDKNDNWISTDKVTMSIQGGRNDGFRGFAYKSNYTPGKWKIALETSGGLEISRLYFEVIASEKQNRDFYVIEK